MPDSVVDCRSTAAHQLLDLFGGEEGWDVIHAMLLNFFKAAAKKWPLSERPMACPDLLSGKMSGLINRRIYVSYHVYITSTVSTDGKITTF